jgi:hypothetical protein
MRSFDEIAFRLRQEVANAWMLVGYHERAWPNLAIAEVLPDPAQAVGCLRGTSFHREIVRLAEGILAGQLPVFGTSLNIQSGIDWRRDYVHAKTTSTSYFRRIPYLDFSRAGDHKWVWEPNRHQHLIALAQAWRLTGDARFINEIWSQLRSWMEQNPFQRGINWASALEVAFRAHSWLWVYHLAGPEMPEDLRPYFLDTLYWHGLHLEYNLSIYFSPNTHLLGEAVALYAIARLFPQFPRSPKWQKITAEIILAQMQSQVREDGSHFEQSTYYHVYAIDFFVLYLILAGDTPAWYRDRLRRMAEYAHSVIGPAGLMPFVGDDDGGRLFHPYGDRRAFGRATMATCSVLFDEPAWLCDDAELHEQATWWLGQCQGEKAKTAAERSRYFEDSGMVVLRAGSTHALFDGGPFGFGTAGHSHSDTLSLTLTSGDDEILIDPGTFTYISEPAERNWFRGTSAHNTVQVAGKLQARPASPFSWSTKPEVEITRWVSNAEFDFVEALCRYEGISHRRQIMFEKPSRFYVLDEIDGADEGPIEQFWHAGKPVKQENTHTYVIGERARLLLGGMDGSDVRESYRSLVFGSKQPAPVITARCNRAPARMAAILDLTGKMNLSASDTARLVERVCSEGVPV